ncbi:unnamed protein product [Alopecurus aequalis]
MAQPALPVPDDLLEEIFVRLPTAADLTRASMSCVSFLHVISGHRFLRRFRILHPPPLLGILCGNLIPAQPPHPSAAAAATFANADFSCSFLPPSRDHWCLREVRDGRALFSPALEGTDQDYNPRDLVREFAVCDPLHRRYLVLPAIPDDLANQVHQPDIVECEPFLAPPGDGEKDSSFRVMCLVRYRDRLVLFVFSSCAGKWLSHPVTFDMFGGSASQRYYAHLCFCWEIYRADKLLVLDTRRMEFCAISLPPAPGRAMREMAIVEIAEGRFGMFTISDQIEYGVYHLLYAVQCMGGGYLLLNGYPEDDREAVDYFSLNLQTFQIEWFFQTGYCVIIGDLYADFPPSLSTPTI